MGQKPITQATVGKATTAICGASRALKQTNHVGLVQESAAATVPLTETLETISLQATKANIYLRVVTLAWAPP